MYLKILDTLLEMKLIIFYLVNLNQQLTRGKNESNI